MAKEIKMERMLRKLNTEYALYPHKNSSKEVIYLFEDFEENDKGEWIPLYLHIRDDDVAFATLNRKRIKTFSSEEELILFIEEEILDLYPDDVPDDEYPWEDMEEQRQYWF